MKVEVNDTKIEIDDEQLNKGFWTAVFLTAVVWREEIGDVIAGAILDLRAGWNNFRRNVWPRARNLVIAVIVIILILWSGFFLIMKNVGNNANAPLAGGVIGILLPIWLIFFLIRFKEKKVDGIVQISPLRKMVNWAFAPILVIATIFLSIGLCSPEFKEGLNRSGKNRIIGWANCFNKNSLNSEVESCIIARLKDDSAGYVGDNKPVCMIPKGTKIMVLNLKGKPKSEKNEGMTKVMTKNKYGEFVGGNVVYVPSSKIDWDKT